MHLNHHRRVCSWEAIPPYSLVEGFAPSYAAQGSPLRRCFPWNFCGAGQQWLFSVTSLTVPMEWYERRSRQCITSIHEPAWFPDAHTTRIFSTNLDECRPHHSFTQRVRWQACGFTLFQIQLKRSKRLGCFPLSQCIYPWHSPCFSFAVVKSRVASIYYRFWCWR